MGLIAILLAAQIASADTIPLPAPAAAVKWRKGRAAVLSGQPGVPQFLVYEDGRPPRSIEVRAALKQARRAEVADFVLDDAGAVHALVLAALPLGRDERLLCSFPGAGGALCSPLKEARCRLLAREEAGSLWCFGEGPADMLLYRLEGSRQGPRFWLPANALPRGAIQTGGRAWLESPAPGRLWLLLDGAALLAETDLESGNVELRRLPGLPLPAGAPSFAACGGRLVALLPLEQRAAAERLDAPYGLFELRDGWRRLSPERRWLRGARLAGCGSGEAWIWNRAGQRLEGVPLSAPSARLPLPRAAVMLDGMICSRRALLLAAAGPREPRIRAMESVMGPMPVLQERVAWRMAGEWREQGYTRRRILFESERDDLVPAWLLWPEQPRQGGVAALCLHQTTKIGKDEPAGLGGKPALHYARELALRGYVALAPDYPGFGGYRCDPYALGYASATMKGIVNHARALRLLAALPGVDGRRIAALGHSLGGHNALFLAAFEPRVAAVVTSCGFTSFRRYMGGDLRGWSHRGYMPRIGFRFDCNPARVPFDFPDVLALIAPRPVFVNAPLRDGNFDVRGVRECLDEVRPLFPEGRLAAEFPDCGHDFPAKVRETAWQFLDRVL